MQMRILRPLEERGIDIKNRSMLLEHLRAGKGSTAARCALALSFLPPDKLTVNELEVAVTQGDDMVSSHATEALRRMGEKAWADKGSERLARFQYQPAKIMFGRDLAWAGRYDGWTDVEAALRDPKSGGAEFSSALGSLVNYVQMRDPSGSPVNFAGLLDEVLSAAVKSGIPAPRLERLQLVIQSIRARKQP